MVDESRFPFGKQIDRETLDRMAATGLALYDVVPYSPGREGERSTEERGTAWFSQMTVSLPMPMMATSSGTREPGDALDALGIRGLDDEKDVALLHVADYGKIDFVIPCSKLLLFVPVAGRRCRAFNMVIYFSLNAPT